VSVHDGDDGGSDDVIEAGVDGRGQTALGVGRWEKGSSVMRQRER
jgi:hypothetical protein